MEITLDQAKRTLGATGEKMTDDEIVKILSIMNYLAEYWLDQAEIKIFGTPIKTLLEQ